MNSTPRQVYDSFHALLGDGESYVPRNRHQTKGHLSHENGKWVLRYREYVRGEDGKTEVAKRTKTLDAISKRAAEDERDQLLAEVNIRNAKPSSSMTVRQFVATKFQLHHVEQKEPAGAKHYAYCLPRVLAVIGDRRLCDVTPDDIEQIVYWARERKLGAQTILHFRNCASAIFRKAKELRLYREENPAAAIHLRVPPSQRRKRATYTLARAKQVIDALKAPYRQMCILSLQTSMHGSEICGLRRKYVNLSDAPIVVEGDVIGPRCIAVRESWYEGKRGNLKTDKRVRNLPIDEALAGMLAAIMAAAPDQSEDAPVFQSRNGTPIDQHNIANRHFSKIKEQFGFPVTWHAFRRAHSSFAGLQTDVPIEDRVATMGHADAKMTLHYSLADVERRRVIPERIMAALMAEPAVSEMVN